MPEAYNELKANAPDTITASPAMPSLPTEVTDSPNSRESDNMKTVFLDDLAVTFDPAKVPSIPAISFANDISGLAKNWHSSNLLVLGGHRISIKHWDKIYKAQFNIKKNAWKSFRLTYSNWQFMINEQIVKALSHHCCNVSLACKDITKEKPQSGWDGSPTWGSPIEDISESSVWSDAPLPLPVVIDKIQYEPIPKDSISNIAIRQRLEEMWQQFFECVKKAERKAITLEMPSEKQSCLMQIHNAMAGHSPSKKTMVFFWDKTDEKDYLVCQHIPQDHVADYCNDYMPSQRRFSWLRNCWDLNYEFDASLACSAEQIARDEEELLDFF
ncbi:hypothetical protein EDD85DRAFT_946270 [Armillaria nabsnona]|nr:hypothetical protein EDD85DRAFT_946270 [Armillaria nabsnona]